jgi:hypothetical protein
MAPKELNNDEKAFLLYCKIGSINLVKIYIDDIRFDVDFIDKDENSPLHIAAINNKKEVFEELINAGAKTDIRNNKGERAIDIALLKCCEENNEELILKLIGIGADVNCKDSEGKRPLDYLNGSAPNFENVARLLIDKGAIPAPKPLISGCQNPDQTNKTIKTHGNL